MFFQDQWNSLDHIESGTTPPLHSSALLLNIHRFLAFSFSLMKQ